MIFTILISIVFIAELIIAVTILLALKRWSKRLRNLNLTLYYIKPSIREICELSRKISAQLVEFSEDFVDKIKRTQEEILLRQISRIILGAFLFRRLKKSKALKLIGKGLSLLEIVV